MSLEGDCLMLNKMRVLAFSHFLQGPAGTQYLADMGADVIKVEPLHGVWERHRHPAGQVPGVNATHLALNRNKRSIAIDLKHALAKDILMPVMETCNVVVENYRVGVLDRLGFGYEDMKARKPDIIYASATGWGSSGPMRDAPGQDLLVQARSGIVSATGTDRPTPVGSPIMDQHGASLLAMGVLAAYVRLLETGVGTRVESNLFNAGIDLQMEAITVWHADLADQSRFERSSNLATWFHEAPYGIYKLKDCHIAISNGPNIGKLPEALGSEALKPYAGSDRLANREEIARIVAEELKRWTWAELDAAFRPHGLWYQKVLADYGELDYDPQAAANEIFCEFPIGDRSVRLVNHPIRYDGKTCAIDRVPWKIGNDTHQVLAEAGFSGSDIQHFVNSGAVAAPNADTEIEAVS
jgi:crotonobetainyl-CoA:carnitine CoA-transferase CaiB-like acyl-CoA transferase